MYLLLGEHWLVGSLLNTVTLSTIEVKYMAVSKVVKELFGYSVFWKLGVVHKHVNVYFNNQSIIHLAKDLVYYIHLKHIDKVVIITELTKFKTSASVKQIVLQGI